MQLFLRNSETNTSGTITAAEGWEHTWNNLNPSWYNRYTVRVTDQLERYTATYEDRHEQTGGGEWNPQYTDTTTITMTFNPPPEPEKINVNAEVVFYGDEYDALGMRPIYATVHLMRDGVLYDTVRIGMDGNGIGFGKISIPITHGPLKPMMLRGMIS